jgi:hypothetical protein
MDENNAQQIYNKFLNILFLNKKNEFNRVNY